jgi:hypothetical protein
MSLSRPNGTIIPDPYTEEPVRDRQVLSGYVSKDAHDQFFRRMFPGSKGLANALVTTFFHKLHAACLADGIPQQFELDNEQRLLIIIERLNFGPEPKRAKSPAPRRTNPPTPIPPTQSAGSKHDQATAD